MYTINNFIRSFQLIAQFPQLPAEEFEIVRTSDFEIGKKYRILRFERMSTKFGNKIIAVLEAGSYFLPPRYARIIKDKNINPENIRCNGLHLTLVGRRDDTFQSPILTFEKI